MESKMLEDFKWFTKNYKILFKKYGSCFLVIKNKKIIGSFKNYKKAIDETKKTEKIGTFIVQECGPDESCYTATLSSIF